ncbi:low affinity immunoglobulin gamma Fc region receptor II-like isoform X1 [Haplochromis burtoni]|uniref:low affinity immunoglobulin gamma Fc region receptor II-like isoform X1 n=1 Tax=Haplochromis burtoni TaxID=8153 RepID=UPI001C2D36D1|nr:low affinity immunoglobulin gamma Fc region receptor II-like isoform X1 [Haplochromis burtoni]
MEITALCTIMATLSIFPNRSQFFRYESVTLSCGELKNSNWTIKRNTSTKTNEECSKHWGAKNESNCFLQDAYPSDSGLYWCDYGAGACSEAVNITVTGGSVILESPVHPLQEGDAATLRCMDKNTSFIPAEFYKDGLLIRNSSTGIMTILKVSKSDEGFYKCTISGSGESPDSWLSVKAGRPKSFHSPPMYVVLPVVGVCLSLAVVLVVLVLLFCLWRNHKGETDPDVSYTDVTIVPEVQPKSDKGKNTCRALFPHVHKSLRHMYVIYITSVFPFCGKL